MKESTKIFYLIRPLVLILVTFICLFSYFALLPMISSFGLPKGAEILIQIAIVFAIIFTTIICVLGNIYFDIKSKGGEK